MNKKQIFALVVWSIFLRIVGAYAQTILVPVGTSQELAPVNWINFSEGLWAEPDNVKGDAEYNRCMATANSAPICTQNRVTAINNDIRHRLYIVMKTFKSGVGLPAGPGGAPERAKLLKDNGLWLEQLP